MFVFNVVNLRLFSAVVVVVVVVAAVFVFPFAWDDKDEEVVEVDNDRAIDT